MSWPNNVFVGTIVLRWVEAALRKGKLSIATLTTLIVSTALGLEEASTAGLGKAARCQAMAAAWSSAVTMPRLRRPAGQEPT